jgi:hypothetical protein
VDGDGGFDVVSSDEPVVPRRTFPMFDVPPEASIILASRVQQVIEEQGLI